MSSYIIYTDKLKGEYKDFFDSVETYGILKNIEQLELEDALSSLLDTLLMAQENGDSVASICGDDIEGFCEEYFNHANALKNSIRALPKSLFYLAIALLCFASIDLLSVDHFEDIFTVSSRLSTIFIGYFIGLIISMFVYIGVKCFDKKHKVKVTHLAIIDVILTIVIIVVYVMKFDALWSFPTLYLMAVTLIYVITFKIFEMYNRYRDHGSVFKSDYEKSLSLRRIFKDSVQEISKNDDIEKEFLKQQIKIYERKHKRTGISEEEYDINLDKEIYWMDVENKYIWIFFVILIVVAMFITGMDSSLVDTCIYGAILCVVEFGVYKVLSPIMRSAVEMRKIIRERVKEEGTTTIKYARDYLTK